MGRRIKKRIPWSEERRAKVAGTWEQKLKEQKTAEALEKVGKQIRGKICAYCGEDWCVTEPVPSLKARRKLSANPEVKFLQVYVCFECNDLLREDESLTLIDRRRNLKIFLRSKYSIFLAWPGFRKETYQHMFFGYRELLDRMNNAKRRIEKRLAYKENE